METLIDPIPENQRNISDKWINNNVYEAMEKIEELCRTMDNGVYDYPPEIQPQLKLQAMKECITEFNILIDNTKELIGETNYREVKLKIIMIKNLNEKGIKDGSKTKYPYQISRNNHYKKSSLVLTNLFNNLKNKLDELRFEMIEFLSPTLFLKSDKIKKNIEV